jgi:tetratricopeptide (TPR) repeat protein
MKDFNDAIPLYEEAIRQREATEGVGSLNYHLTRSMAAGAYRDSGKPEKALEYLKDSYVGVAQLNEGNEETVASAILLNSMGLTYKKMQKYDRAEDSYKRCLEVRESLLGESHPDAMATRHSLAELYIEWGVKDSLSKALLEKNVYLADQRETLLEQDINEKAENDPEMHKMTPEERKKLAKDIY